MVFPVSEVSHVFHIFPHSQAFLLNPTPLRLLSLLAANSGHGRKGAHQAQEPDLNRSPRLRAFDAPRGE